MQGRRGCPHWKMLAALARVSVSSMVSPAVLWPSIRDVVAQAALWRLLVQRLICGSASLGGNWTLSHAEKAALAAYAQRSHGLTVAYWNVGGLKDVSASQASPLESKCKVDWIRRQAKVGLVGLGEVRWAHQQDVQLQKKLPPGSAVVASRALSRAPVVGEDGSGLIKENGGVALVVPVGFGYTVQRHFAPVPGFVLGVHLTKVGSPLQWCVWVVYIWGDARAAILRQWHDQLGEAPQGCIHVVLGDVNVDGTRLHASRVRDERALLCLLERVSATQELAVSLPQGAGGTYFTERGARWSQIDRAWVTPHLADDYMEWNARASGIAAWGPDGRARKAGHLPIILCQIPKKGRQAGGDAPCGDS